MYFFKVICQKFVEMTPKERFKELRRRGLCHQCLFPGAKQNFGKHSEGKCQRDFCCKNTWHDRYQTKKHVLVCQEHSESTDNEQLLQEYKDKCIVKIQNQLPTFSKQLKLAFHSSSNEVSSVVNNH